MRRENADGSNYETENVPWISYFYQGYALQRRIGLRLPAQRRSGPPPGLPRRAVPANDKLAGQTVDMRVTLHAIKIHKLPEVNDEFAELTGNYSSVREMEEAIEKSYLATRKQLVKGDAQKKLLDGRAHV